MGRARAERSEQTKAPRAVPCPPPLSSWRERGVE